MFKSCSRLRIGFALMLGLLFAANGSATQAQTAVNVLTRSYNNQRIGSNASETTLTPANVNSGQFGMLFSRPVDGEVYAQPLYVAGMTINGATHNVLFVATMHDTVYAFDADDPAAATPLWKTSYFQTIDGTHPVAVPTSSVPTADMGFACGGSYNDISLEVGILSTPVIDKTTNIMYVLARTKEVGGAAGTYVQRLHAINIYTGLDVMPPVVIQASYPTKAGGNIFFDSLVQNQRPGLLLDHGRIYIAWASHCDSGNYHGWLMAYDAASLTQKGVFCSTPDGGQGGIWQSGQGPSADAAGNVYIVVGNGDTSIKAGGTGYGNAVVKLKLTASGFSVLDWFMPYNTDGLTGADLDSTLGPTLVPGPNGATYVIMGGKNGQCYIMDSAKMGKYNPNNPGSPQNDNQIIESFQITTDGVHGSPAYLTGPGGTYIYLWGENVPFKGYAYNGATFTTTPFSQSTNSAPSGEPGGIPTVSSNAGANGIVWVNLSYAGSANQAVVPGILRAFDATDLTKELWNSHQSPGRDDFGNFAKYCPPVVTNGKVYMATFSNQVVAYGILPAPLAPSNLIATGGPGAIGLNWTAGPYASSYNIQRSLSVNGTFTSIATGVTTTSYTDTGLTNGTTYYYKVSATNTLGTSGYSNIASGQPAAAVVGTGTGLNGQYFVDPGDGTHLNANTLTAARIDPTVNYIWNGASPAPGVPGTNFSARWMGQIMAPVTGYTTFTITGDDGVRLWVNGQLVANGWADQAPTAYSGSIALTAGQKYSITMEFYQGGGGDEAILSWSYPGQTDIVIPATQLYPTLYAPGTPANLAAAGGNQSVGLTWSPALYAVSYNVKRSLTAAGPFTTIASNVANNYYTDSGLTNGTTYYYVVSSVNTVGESANSNIANATPARGNSNSGDGLLGTYYTGNDANFTPENGTPFLTIVDATINFDLNNGVGNNPRSWDAGVPGGNYTTVWTGQILAPVTGPYKFYTNSDDGARLSLNSGSGLNAIISAPYYQGPTQFASPTITLAAGQLYDIKLEYFQGGGGATCQLFWSYPGVGQQIIPQTNLFSNHNGVAPGAPATLNAVGLNQAAQLSWAAANGASTYNVKRSSTPNGAYTLFAGGITTTTYIDMGLTNGTTYYYKVSASNAAVESADSPSAFAVPQGAALVLHYTYEDGPQGNNPDVISDVSLNGNAGQMIGGDAGFTNDATQALYAAVIGAGVHPSLPANFNFGDQFTIFTYAKMNDAAGIQTILSNGASGGKTPGFAFYVNDYNNQSHALVFEANSGGANNVQTKTRTAANALPIGDGAYHAVAITVNRPLGIVNFYVDGVAQTSSNLVQANYSTQQPNTYLGVFTDNFAETTGAEFDDLQIYSGMLNAADVAALSNGGGTVTGQVALEGVNDLTQTSAGAPLGALTFKFRKPGTLSDVFTTTGAITPVRAGSAFGRFTLTGVPLGTYDMTIKGLKNLRVSVPGISIGASSVVPNVSLPAGDANNDNSVDSTDFGLLIGAFNTSVSVSGSGYDPTVDFNFDGSVDSTDFGLLIGEFNNVGAN